MLKCFRLILHVHNFMMIPINRNHQGREMCTSRTHNKFTWSGLMIYEMNCVRNWLILYPYLLNFFYVLLPYPPSTISGNKFKMISVSTCYFGVTISCVRYGLFCYMQDKWNAFGEMKMLIFYPPNGQSWRRSSLQSVQHFPLRVRRLKTVCIYVSKDFLSFRAFIRNVVSLEESTN